MCKGARHSAETRRKISLALIGNKRWLGKKHTAETRKKMSLVQSKKVCSEKEKQRLRTLRFGRKTSEETKAKQRLSHLRNPMSNEHKEKIRLVNSLRRGFKHSENSKEKMRLAKFGKYEGAKSHFWKGGISCLPYAFGFNKKLKVSVRERDYFTCRNCGRTENQLGYALNCHHIDYNKKNHAPNNLISLCRGCHAQTNFGREDWKGYFERMM